MRVFSLPRTAYSRSRRARTTQAKAYFVNVCCLKLHRVMLSLDSVWKNDFDIVHVLLRAVHRQHVQSAMQRYQAR